MHVEPGTIVFYSDIGCPWASLAVHRLRRRRSELGLDAEVVVDHRAFPLELFNSRATPKRLVDSEVAVVGSHEPSLGWRPWDGPEWAYPGSTLLPLAAVQAAKSREVGGVAASEQLDAALRHAWWAEGRSIHLYTELLQVARACDRVDAAALDRAVRAGAGWAAVFEQRQNAEDCGVQGSPHLFVCGGLDVHNPGITMRWTDGKFRGMPVIERDEPAIYDQILRQASRRAV
jgi:predicted DsbA family dithiol-disulfide isomerase